MSKDVEPKTFPITTLRDIYNLPTFEQMEVCLDEVTKSMIQARAVNDLAIETAEAMGTPIDQAFVWPDVLEWVDDNKGEVGVRFGDHDGKEMFSVMIKKKEEK